MYAHTPRGYIAVCRGLAFRRRIRRARLTPGALHIDDVIRDCLDRRLDRDETAVRLLVAADLAAVLEASS